MKIFIIGFSLLFSFTVFSQEDDFEHHVDSIQHVVDEEQAIKDSLFRNTHANAALKKYAAREVPEVPVPDHLKVKNIKYHVSVVDKNTKKALKASVDLSSIAKDGSVLKGKGRCSSTGEFTLNLAANSELQIYVVHPMYLPKSHKVNLEEYNEAIDIDEVSHTFEMEPIPVDEYVQLENINFEQGKYTLLQESFKELDQLVFMMKTNPEMEIELAGHTDNTGSKAASVKLSEKRVESVKKYLVSKGISSKRIQEVGYGSERPLVSGNTAEEKRLNRRVEFKIIKM